MALVFLLASPCSCSLVPALGQGDNTTDAGQLNSSSTAASPPSPQTNMSYTFLARPNVTVAPPLAPVITPDRYNVSVVESWVESVMKSQNINKSNEEALCLVRKRGEVYLDFDAPEYARYCASYYDGILCWPASLPGVINRSCPALLNAIKYDVSFDVTRYCNLDGTWANGNKSNYSLCTAQNVPDLNGHDIALPILVYVGYSLSFTALMVAFCIFLCFKSLRCVRNYIHWNLVSSFVLLYIAYFSTTGAANLVKEKPELLWLCRLAFIVLIYVMMTNFFWMFVEGVYLYTLVVRALTVRRNRFWIYCLFGWGTPVPFVITYAIVKKLKSEDANCWVSQDRFTYIIVSPIFLVIVVNLYFLIHIMAILVTKLRASHSLETQQYRKGVRGTLFLLPLLGVTYLLFVLGPVSVANEKRTAAFHAYQYISTALSSLQGFFVAVIYVLFNQEVQNVIKRKIRRWREESTLPSRVVSRRGSTTRTSFGGSLGLFGGRRTGHSSTGGESEHVAAFKLPGGKGSPSKVSSNGSNAPPFIRLDEVQPLTPLSDVPSPPPTLYSSLSSANGAEVRLMTGEEAKELPCGGTADCLDVECNELPLLSVNTCGKVTAGSGVGPDSSLDSSSCASVELLCKSPDNNGVLNGNHNNNHNNNNNNNNNNGSSLATCLAQPKAASSPSAGRSRVTFADELVRESHKRPACCDAGKNAEANDRSPKRKQDWDKLLPRGQMDGEDLTDSVAGRQDTQRSPLLPFSRKKPNGTIAFPKAPEGTPV